MINGIELRQVYRAYRDYAGRLVVLAVFSFANALAEVATIASLIPLIATVASSEPTAFQGTAPLLGWSISLSVEQLLMICLTAILSRTIIQMLGNYLGSRVVTTYEAEQRTKLVKRFLDASWSVQAEEKAGRLLNLMTENIPRGRAALHSISQLLVAFCNFVVLLVIAFVADPFVALAAVVVSGILFVASTPLSRIARQMAYDKADLNVDFAADVTQAVRLAKEIRVFHARDIVRKQILDVVEKVRRGRFVSQFLSLTVPVLYQNVAALAIVGGLAANYYLQFSSPTRLGLIAVLLIRALTYGQVFQTNFHTVVESLPYMGQINAMRETYHAGRVVSSGSHLARVDRLRFEQVCFSYRPGEPVLRDVDFEIERGEVVGIVGPSGSGKSTLVELLLRLRQPTNGRILVNNAPSESFSLASWCRAFAYVSQDAQLLTGTVYENIRFFRQDLTLEMAQDAARKAGVHEVIAAMPSGYETSAGERAASFSGGQRQRICIARALAGKPEVVVLDEPTSALDVHSEAIVQGTIRQLRGHVTTVIVAHRLSTLNVCDRIIVLREGMIEAFGPPEKISLTNDYFSEAMRVAEIR